MMNRRKEEVVSIGVVTDHICDNAAVVKRAVVSTGPPGGNGTIKFTGLSGQAAFALDGAIANVAPVSTRAEAIAAVTARPIKPCHIIFSPKAQGNPCMNRRQSTLDASISKTTNPALVNCEYQFHRNESTIARENIQASGVLQCSMPNALR